MTEALHLYYRTVSNSDLQTEISQLTSQMQSLQPGSAQYEYDQLQLAFEERELEIRKENPQIDPTTQEGAKALAQMMGQDSKLQEILNEIRTLTNAHPNECTSWGIPLD